MADFFREVDEDVRRDRILKLWTKHRSLIIALAVIIVAGTGGWRFYAYHRDQAATAAGTKYEAAAQLSREKKPAEAAAAFNALSKASPKGYASLARLRAGNELAVSDPQAAIKIYEELAEDPGADPTFKDLARLRAAMLRVDIDDPLEFERKFGPLAADTFAYHGQIRELLGLAALKRNDLDAARRWFEGITSDPRAPAGVRARAEALLGLAQSAAAQVDVKQAANPAAGAQPAK
jgi:hypothetical protein